MRQSAYELHMALANLGITPPDVLVGQSLGGMLVRTFASQYPQEVVGVVLVDSAHEDAQRNLKGKIVRIREMSQGRAIPPIQTSIAAADKALSADERQRIFPIAARQHVYDSVAGTEKSITVHSQETHPKPNVPSVHRERP